MNVDDMRRFYQDYEEYFWNDFEPPNIPKFPKQDDVNPGLISLSCFIRGYCFSAYDHYIFDIFGQGQPAFMDQGSLAPLTSKALVFTCTATVGRAGALCVSFAFLPATWLQLKELESCGDDMKSR